MLSTDNVKEFPFAVTMFNITSIAVQCLREQILNSLINELNSVFDGLLKFI